MESIADAKRTHSHRDRRRLVAGVGLMLFGACIGGLGLARVLGAATLTDGLAAVGLAGILSWLVVSVGAPLNERERAIAATGLILGFAAVAIFWAAGQSDIPSVTAGQIKIVVLVYVGALSLVIATVLAAVSISSLGRGNQSNKSSPGWVRRSNSQNSQPSTDGGQDKDELSFPRQGE